MCNQGCRTDDCAHQRETDTWLSRDLTPRFLPPLAPVDAPQAPEGVHQPQMGRDGGDHV